MADEITIVVNAEDNFSGVLGNFGNIMTGIKSTIDLVSGAIQGASEFVGQFVDSASESEQAVARLEGVLRATGGAAGLTSDDLQNMANSLQDVTRFSDETILNGEAILLTFRNISGEMFERTVPAMADMAEIFGSVDSAAMQLGKALNDPLTGMGALSRAGITFSEDQKKAIQAFMDTNDIASAQNIILTEVENQVHGLAEAMGDTFSGKVAIFNNALDTVKETIGGALLPILGNFLQMFQDALPTLQNFAEALATAISTGNFSALFATFEDGSNYMGTFFELLGMGEEKAYAFGDAINQIITNFNFAPLGDLLLEAVNNIDWTGLSQKLADSISSIDWGYVGNKIAEGLGYLAIVIGTVLSEIDWGALLSSIGQAVADFFAGLFGFVNWDDMWNNAKAGFGYVGQQIVNSFYNTGQDSANQLVDGMIAGITVSADAIGVIIYDAITKSISGVKNYIMNDLGNIVAGTFNIDQSKFNAIGWDMINGIREGISDAWNWLVSEVRYNWNVLVYDIKALLGISSPSTVFYGIAKDIIQGLIDGFEYYWQGLIDLATSSLEDFLRMFGIDISFGGTSASGLGSASGGVATGGTSTGTSGTGTVNNYFYGNVYFQGLGDIGYDCPSPNPLMTAASGTVIPNGAA